MLMYIVSFRVQILIATRKAESSKNLAFLASHKTCRRLVTSCDWDTIEAQFHQISTLDQHYIPFNGETSPKMEGLQMGRSFSNLHFRPLSSNDFLNMTFLACHTNRFWTSSRLNFAMAGSSLSTVTLRAALTGMILAEKEVGGPSHDDRLRKRSVGSKMTKNWVVVSNIFIFPSLPREMIQFDEHVFQMG